MRGSTSKSGYVITTRQNIEESRESERMEFRRRREFPASPNSSARRSNARRGRKRWRSCSELKCCKRYPSARSRRAENKRAQYQALKQLDGGTTPPWERWGRVAASAKSPRRMQNFQFSPVPAAPARSGDSPASGESFARQLDAELEASSPRELAGQICSSSRFFHSVVQHFNVACSLLTLRALDDDEERSDGTLYSQLELQ